MDNFIRKITVLVKERLGNNFDIRIDTIKKNNDTELHGLVILERGQPNHLVPALHLEDFFQAYRQGIPLEDITTFIIDSYNAYHVELDFDANKILNYAAIKNQISFHLINSERNTKFLQDIPHLQYLDFSIIFRINIESDNLGTESIVVNNYILKTWGISVEELYKNALESTQQLMPCSIKKISRVISELLDIDTINDSFPMYVITNEEMVQGCGCILYPDVLKNFSNIIKSDLYLLPSSIHEMLILPVTYFNSDALRNIVHDVNVAQISENEFLSDNVYRYCRDTKRIEIVPS